MAFGYTYDQQTHIVRIAGEGVVSIAERVALVTVLLADPQLPERATVLVVVDRVTNAPTAEEVAVIGLLIDRLQARFRGRVAIVNVTVGHVTLSHFVAVSAGGGFGDVMVFGSEAAATGWLLAAP